MHEKKSQFILLKISPHVVRLLGKIHALSIEVLHERIVYSFVPGRSYVVFQDIAANPFNKLEGDFLRDWISSSLKTLLRNISISATV